MQKRNSYLISGSLKNYLTASIVTMAVLNINGMIDGMLMGQMLGPDALSSIQASMPVITTIGAVNQLLTGGAAVIISKALGRRDAGESNSSLTACLISNVVAGILIIAFSRFLSNALASLFCVDNSLIPDSQKYIQVLLMGSIFLILQNGLSVLVDVAGGPRVVTLSMCFNVVGNLFFDILLVKVIGMDIRGAALATVIGAVFSIVVLIIFFIKKREELQLKLSFDNFGSILGRNIVKGIPGLISSLSLTVLTMICNFFVQIALAKTGMFVISVGFALINLGNMIGNGVGMSFLSIGGVLEGQKDYNGLRMLVRKGMKISLLSALFFNVLAWVIPDKLAMMYGASDTALISMCKGALPFVATYIFALSFISPLSVVFQLNDHVKLATAGSFSLIVSLAIGFTVACFFMAPENIWNAFPIGSILAIGFVCIASMITRRQVEPKPEKLSLIPYDDPKLKKLDISIECTKEGINAGINDVNAFMEAVFPGRRFGKIVHCIEELLINYQKFSGRSSDNYMDLCITADETGVSVLYKDDGIPFDPINVNYELMKSGLKILRFFSGNVSYSNSFGENIIFMRWSYEEIEA